MGWDELSLQTKSDLMKIYIKHGIISLNGIQNHYNSLATGGNLSNPEDWEPPEGWEASGAVNYRAAVGKRSDMTMTPQMTETAKRHYANALHKVESGELPYSRIVDAYNFGKNKGWSDNDIWGYVYNAATSFSNEQNSKKDIDNPQLQTAISTINSPQAPQYAIEAWINWLKDNYPSVNPYDNSTYKELLPTYNTMVETAKENVKKQKEVSDSFMKDVQSRKNYKGLSTAMTAATFLPLATIIGETSIGASLLKRTVQNASQKLGTDLVMQGVTEGVGYGLEALSDQDKEGIYNYLQEHPALNKAVNYSSDVGAAFGYALDRYGEATQNSRISAIGKTLMTTGSIIDGLQGGMAARDIQQRGFQLGNTGDFIIGLLPSSWNTANSSVDEAVRVGSQLLGVGNDAIIGNIPEED